MSLQLQGLQTRSSDLLSTTSRIAEQVRNIANCCLVDIREPAVYSMPAALTELDSWKSVESLTVKAPDGTEISSIEKFRFSVLLAVFVHLAFQVLAEEGSVAYVSDSFCSSFVLQAVEESKANDSCPHGPLQGQSYPVAWSHVVLTWPLCLSCSVACCLTCCVPGSYYIAMKPKKYRLFLRCH